MTVSKFHALNFKIGASLPFWTLLKKVHAWRKRNFGDSIDEVEGDDDTGNAEQKDEDPSANPRDNVQELLQKLRKLQKGQHTLDLAASIYGDTRVRQLGYMTLDRQTMRWCIFLHI